VFLCGSLKGRKKLVKEQIFSSVQVGKKGLRQKEKLNIKIWLKIYTNKDMVL
jgi:hypothetical protein